MVAETVVEVAVNNAMDWYTYTSLDRDNYDLPYTQNANAWKFNLGGL